MDRSPPVAVVGLEKTVYQVDEGACRVEVCVEVKTTSEECIVPFSFDVHVTTMEGTGIIKGYLNVV